LINQINFDGSSISKKKVGTGEIKAGKVSGSKKKQLEEHIAINQINWKQVSDMIGYKKEHLREAEFPRNKDGSTNCGTISE